MPDDTCHCHQWTCADRYSLARRVIGAHHPMCGRGLPLTSDELIDGLLARVNGLETEVNALRAAADAGVELAEVVHHDSFRAREWWDGLQDRVERVQALTNRKGANADG